MNPGLLGGKQECFLNAMHNLAMGLAYLMETFCIIQMKLIFLLAAPSLSLSGDVL